MQPGGDKPAYFHERLPSPYSSLSQSSAPGRPSEPVRGSGPTGASQTTSPFFTSGPVSSPGLSTARAPAPVRFNGPVSAPPQPSFSLQNTNVYTQTQAPTCPPPAQPVPPLHGPPQIGPGIPSLGPIQPPTQIPSSPISFPPQTSYQMPMPNPVSNSPFSAAKPLFQGYTNVLLNGDAPPPLADSQFPTPRMNAQPPFQAFSGPCLPAGQPQFSAHQGGPMQIPPPRAGLPVGFNYMGQIQHPIAGPPTGGTPQALVEDFQSLSVGSAPGSHDAGLDPDSLPRPLDDDEESTSVLETYPFNCHPNFLRLTTHAIPSSQSLLARWHLPLGVVVHPLAEVPVGEKVPLVNFGLAGIIRCRRCRTYVNPYVTFTDAGRKWRCNLCSLLNDVSGEYFCSLDANGRRYDMDQRPELSKGSVDFVASTEYMVRPPMPPIYFFLIDVSVTAVRSGLLEVVAQTIKLCLDELPGFPRTQIGFLTFDNTLHFYCLKSSLTQPQMMVVTDLDDIFVPLPDDILVNLSDSRSVVDAFLDSLPSTFENNLNVESAFGPALKAAHMVMSQLGGKLLIFQSTLPSLGVGRLKLRGDDLRVYGTDKEHTCRIPEDQFYKQMAADFVKEQIAVDVYVFSDKYSDVASLGVLTKYTGGQVYYYPSFQASIHHEKLRHELARDLTRETAWESVLRIRCGKGVRFTTYHGHFMLRSTDLLALPAIDCDKAVAMQLCLEDTLMTTQTVYFQVALLYTSSSGERRIRVHTAAVPVVTDLGEMYRRADTGAIISLLSRLAIECMWSRKLEDARQLVQAKLAKSLKEYRNLYAVHHRLGGRLIFPESLKYLPLYVFALCKSIPLRGGYGDAPLDERCAVGHSMMILPVRRLLKLLYPSLHRVDNGLGKVDGFQESSKKLALTIYGLNPSGLYVFDDGFSLVIWLGRALPRDMVNDVLGIDISVVPDLSKITLSEHDNEVSRKMMKIIRRAREKDASCYKLCHIVMQGEQPREGCLLLNKLVEDQNAGMSSYKDWILQLHRQSQSSGK